MAVSRGGCSCGFLTGDQLWVSLRAEAENCVEVLKLIEMDELQSLIWLNDLLCVEHLTSTAGISRLPQEQV